MNVILALLLVLAVAFLGLAVHVFFDRRADRTERTRLVALQPKDAPPFAAEMLAGLPEPARRFFSYAIRPGTPLLPVAQIKMTGRFSLGTKPDPRYQPMDAHQVLSAPYGFLWDMKITRGMPVAGSDSGLWTRFRVFGLIPVARAGGPRSRALGVRAPRFRGADLDACGIAARPRHHLDRS